MPDVYRTLVGQMATNTVPPIHVPTAQQAMRNTPGGRVMLQHNPLNFTQLFAAYVQLYRPIWVWNPGHTPSAGEVRDGIRMFGQCAAFSRGLHLLATAPAPYGLGLAPDRVPVVRYNGLRSNGFISPHVGTHFGLNANVIQVGTTDAPVLEDLYYWDNHYVLQYIGRYYDPSYDTEYTTLDEMASYELQQDTVRHDGADWETARVRDRTYYFRLHWDIADAGRRLPVEGPFAALP